VTLRASGADDEAADRTDRAVVCMVVRTDDNGRTVLVRDGLPRAAAERPRRALAARGHKQDYAVLAYRDAGERVALVARHGIAE
jgi:hypothetical protein